MEEKIDSLREIFPLTSREILLQSLNNNNGVICSETLDEIILRESVLEDEEENFDSRNTNNREEKMIEELSYQFPSLTKEDIWIFLEVSNIENWVDKEVIELVPMIREQHLLQIEKFKKPKRTQINNPIVSINRSFINNSINSIKDLLPILLTSLNKEWEKSSGRFDLICSLREEGRSLHEERINLSKKAHTADRIREMGVKAKTLEDRAAALIFEEANPTPLPFTNGLIVLDFHHLFVDEALRIISTIQEYEPYLSRYYKGIYIITGVGLHSNRSSGPRLLPKIMFHLQGKITKKIVGGLGVQWFFKI